MKSDQIHSFFLFPIPPFLLLLVIGSILNLDTGSVPSLISTIVPDCFLVLIDTDSDITDFFYVTTFTYIIPLKSTNVRVHGLKLLDSFVIM